MNKIPHRLSWIYYQDQEIAFGEVETAQGTQPLLEYPVACGVIPLRPGKSKADYMIYMVEQYRVGSNSVSLEFPAGKSNAREAPIKTVERELREEAGLKAEKLTHAHSYYPAIGISSEILHLYLATGLQPLEPDPDEDEEIVIKQVSLEQLEKRVFSGEIFDSKTILGTYWLLFYLQNETYGSQ